MPGVASPLPATVVSFGGIPRYSYVTLESRPGVTESFLLMDTEDAKATVILLAGGDGRLGLTATGLGPFLMGNFLIRTRDLYLTHKIRVAVLDVPSDVVNLSGFRLTPEHGQDLRAAIAYLRHRFHGPVWVSGTRNGSVSAVNVASRYPGHDGPDGIIASAGVFIAPGASVFDADLASVTAATLVVHHEQDACPATAFAVVPAFLAALTGVDDLELLTFTGGGPLLSAPCDAFHYHGFIGIDAQVVDAMADFIRDAGRHHGHGHGH